jgi:GT2 family glycosyltransferase
VLDAARGAVVYDPAWVVTAPGARPLPAATLPTATLPAATLPTATGAARFGAHPSFPDTGDRLLVLPGALPRDLLSAADRFGDQLITSLVECCPAGAVTVLASGAHLATGRLAQYRSLGVEVHTGPIDLQRWFTARWGWFSHVFLSGSATNTSARHWIEETQPQAARVVAFPSLPFRDVETLRAVTPGDELPGLDAVRSAVEARVALLARWADAAWCQQEPDVAFLRNFVLDKEVVHIPPRLPPTAPAVPFGDRRGLLLFATEGDDVIQGNEDATVFVLREHLPWLRRRLSSLPVTVVSGAPSPLLRHAADAAGAEVISPASASGAAAAARLVLVAHQFGTGGTEAIRAALAAGTPFVTTPHAARSVDLGPLAALAVFGDPFDIRQQSLSLLDDPRRWHTFAAAAQDRLRAPDTSVDDLRLTLARLGVIPVPEGRPRPPGIEPPTVWHPPVVATRPEGYTPRSAPVGPEDGLDDEATRYGRWTERLGGTEDLLPLLRREVSTLRYQPLISVVMPVYNTDPETLAAAIDSVRDQVYANWQLCLVDDGSSDPATVRFLDALPDTPAIDVIRLARQSGISAATNAGLEAATGEYVAFLDHDDVLKPHALAQVARWLDADPTLDVIYSDEDKLDARGRLFQPHLKPDWAPNHLMSQNYVCHLLVARAALVAAVGGMRSICDGSQDWDLVLRLTEATERIAHIPEPLYSWRLVEGSAAAEPDAKPYALTAARTALRQAMARRGRPGVVDDGPHPGLFRARDTIPGAPRVAIVIPTRNGADLLRRCITSIFEKSTYTNYELVIIDNQSDDADTLGYLAGLPATVLRYPHLFNYARMMNLAARSVECDALLFLNNDTEVITPGWIEALLEHAMRPEVGAVGGRLYFGDGRPQHEGILIGVFGGWAANIDHGGYFSRGDIVRDTSAVTGACTMIRPDVYWRVGGNDERLRVAYNDVDLCLRVHQAGYQVVYTPYAELFHYESSTRSGFEHHEDGPLFGVRWRPKELVDPYYSPVFTRGSPFKIVN